MKKYAPLAVASIFYFAVIIFYAYHLGWISEDPSRWGEFGDFMGGVVNPIIGLVTIWLLVVTLKQSEFSHKQQLVFNAEIRDFEICLALISYYENNARDLAGIVNQKKEQLMDFTYILNQDKNSILERKKEIRDTELKVDQFFGLSNELKSILEKAHSGLKKKYINS